MIRTKAKKKPNHGRLFSSKLSTNPIDEAFLLWAQFFVQHFNYLSDERRMNSIRRELNMFNNWRTIWPNEYVEKELKMKWLKRDGEKKQV